MAKKLFLVLALLAAISGAAFSQITPHKYQSSDMLLGINFGMGVTPNAVKLASYPWPVANVAVTMDFGLSLDYYLFPWLSLNSGAFAKSGAYLALNIAMDEDSIDLSDIAKTPICLTIPLTAHINVPFVNFLYLGAGGSINIPLSSWTVKSMDIGDSVVAFGAKGDMFYSLILDLGFDFVKKNKGGSRFIFRLEPEFHKEGRFITAGFMWQLYNFRIYSKKA